MITYIKSECCGDLLLIKVQPAGIPSNAVVYVTTAELDNLFLVDASGGAGGIGGRGGNEGSGGNGGSGGSTNSGGSIGGVGRSGHNGSPGKKGKPGMSGPAPVFTTAPLANLFSSEISSGLPIY